MSETNLEFGNTCEICTQKISIFEKSHFDEKTGKHYHLSCMTKKMAEYQDKFIAMGDGSNITKKRENIDYSARDYDGSNRI